MVDLAQPGLIKPNERTSADLRLATKRRTQPASPLNSRRTHHLGENVERNVQSFGVEWKTTGGAEWVLSLTSIPQNLSTKPTLSIHPSHHHQAQTITPSKLPGLGRAPPRPRPGSTPSRSRARFGLGASRERLESIQWTRVCISHQTEPPKKHIYTYMHEYVYSYYILCNC